MNYLLLGIGLLILIKGADIMVESASKIAIILKVPAFVVGLFIVAIGTSTPEAAIGVFSGIQGTNLITLGDVVGSSIVNITLVLGITAMVFPLRVDSQVPKREIPLSIFIQIALIGMFFTGYILSRGEAAILLFGMLLFIAYIASKTKRILKNEQPESIYEKEMFEYIEEEEVLSDSVIEEEFPTKVINEEKTESLPKLIFLFLLGLIGLVIGADISVNNAIEIAHVLGLSEAFIGLTIVAFGTSLPELVTCLMAALKREEDIAVGNIIGSNIFNVLLVLGLSGMLHPIAVGTDVFVDLLFMIATSILLLVPTFFFGNISKRTGFIFLTSYVLYLMFKLNGLS